MTRTSSNLGAGDFALWLPISRSLPSPVLLARTEQIMMLP
jgi:hypothetical protein